MSDLRLNHVLSSDAAMANTRRSGKGRMYPREEDPRVEDHLVIPHLSPRFQLNRGDRVFTIGSCFAREIEEHLHGFDLPTREIALGPELVPHRPNSILNEYNAACMTQRIEWAVSGRDTTQLAGLTREQDQGNIDLLLSKGHPVSLDMIMQIRRQIDGIYTRLPVADCVILTLGMTEVWYDNEQQVFLNRLPNPRELRDAKNRRYSFVNMTPQGCYEHMARGITALANSGVTKILLTVSPVPLGATFEPHDCIIANSYSKATLRVVADMLTRDFPIVDYFPSYEIVTSGGIANSYQPDHIHVRGPVVRRIMRHLVENYVDGGGAGAK